MIVNNHLQLNIMSTLQESLAQSSVYICNFQCYITQVNVTMKFPCSYFIQWRTINSKISVNTQKHNPQNNQIIFSQKMNLSLQMIFDQAKNEFLKRETIIELFLVSKSRPDQVKLVGRVNIQVSKVINFGMYEDSTIFNLNFCSIEGTITMKFKVIEKELTSKKIQNLDRTSFAEYISRTDFKSQNKYESIVLNKYENKAFQKSSLEKTTISDVRKSPRYFQNNKEKVIPKGNLLNESLFESEHRLVLPIRSNLLQKKSLQMKERTLRQNQVIEGQNQSFSKATCQNQQKSNGLLMKYEQQRIALSKELTQLKDLYSQKIKEMLQLKEQNIHKDNEIQELQEANSQCKKSIEYQKNYIQQLQSINSQQVQLNSKLASELQAISQQNDKNKEMYINANSELKQIRLLNQELKKETYVLDSLNFQLKQKIILIKNNEIQLERLREQLKNELIKNEKLLHIKNRAESLELQNMLLNTNLKNQEQNMQIYEITFNNFEQFIIKLQKDNEKCNERVRQSEQIELQLKRHIEELEIENNQLITELRSMRDDPNDEILRIQLQEVKLSYQAQLAILHHYNEEINQKYEKAQSELILMKDKYSSLQTLYFELQEKEKNYSYNSSSRKLGMFQNSKVQIIVQSSLSEHSRSNKSEKSSKKGQLFKMKCNQAPADQNLQDQLRKKNENQYEQNVRVLQQRCNDYELTIKSINASLEEEIDRNHDLQRVITQYMEKEFALKESYSLLESQLNVILDKLRQKQKEERENMRQINQLQSEFENNQDHLSEIKEEVSPNQSHKYDQQEALDIQKRSYLLKIREELLANHSQMMQKNNQTKQKIKEMNLQIGSLVQKHRSNRNNLQNHVQELTEQLYELGDSSVESKIQEIADSNNSAEKSQYDLFKDINKDKGKEYYEFQHQLYKLKNYVEKLEEEKNDLELFRRQQEEVIEELQQSNDELMELLKRNESSVNSMIIFKILDQLKETMFKSTKNDDWDTTLQAILDKSIVKQNVSRLLNLDEKIRSLSNQIQKMKFQILSNDSKDETHKNSILNLIKNCQEFALELIQTTSILNENQN